LLVVLFLRCQLHPKLHPWKYVLPANSIVAAAFNDTFRGAVVSNSLASVSIGSTIIPSLFELSILNRPSGESGLDGEWNCKRLGLLGSTTYKNGATTPD
jgi:hypothetical protein